MDIRSRIVAAVLFRNEPSLYANYLITADRNAEAVDFSSKAASDNVDKLERPYLLNAWANALENTGGDAETALGYFEKALKLKPDYWRAWRNAMSTLCLLGREKEAWSKGQAMRAAAGGRPGAAPEITYNIWDSLTWNLQAWRAALVADVEAHGGVGSELSAETPIIAEIDIRLHDPASAKNVLTTTLSDHTSPTVAAMTHFAKGRAAAENADTQTAVLEMAEFGKSLANPVVSSNYPGYECWIVLAEEAAGHPDQAEVRKGRQICGLPALSRGHSGSAR